MKPCTCFDRRTSRRYGDLRRYLFAVGHDRECPQYQPLRVPNAVRARPLVKPLRRLVGKRRERRGQTKPR